MNQDNPNAIVVYTFDATVVVTTIGNEDVAMQPYLDGGWDFDTADRYVQDSDEALKIEPKVGLSGASFSPTS